jgi:hypothetical protein
MPMSPLRSMTPTNSYVVEAVRHFPLPGNRHCYECDCRKTLTRRCVALQKRQAPPARNGSETCSRRPLADQPEPASRGRLRPTLHDERRPSFGLSFGLSSCWNPGVHLGAHRPLTCDDVLMRTPTDAPRRISKACEGASSPWVQIPPPPPGQLLLGLARIAALACPEQGAERHREPDVHRHGECGDVADVGDRPGDARHEHHDALPALPEHD